MSDIALELARKEFEEWAKGPKLPLKRDRTLYAEYMTQLAWSAWKAALLQETNPMSTEPRAAETATTAEQDIQQVLDFYNNWHDHSDDFTPDRDTVGLVLAYAAHVRENDPDRCAEYLHTQQTFLVNATIRARTAERKLAEAQRLHDEYRVKDQQYLFHLEGAIETKTAKLAELEKEYEHALSCMDRSCKRCGAALASLRAESKEPVD